METTGPATTVASVQGEWAEDVLCERLVTVTNGVHRLFFLNIFLSLAIVYLVISTSVQIRIEWAKAPVREQLSNLEPLLTLADEMRAEPNVFASYRDFLRPFLAIEDAATQAIIAVDAADPR